MDPNTTPQPQMSSTLQESYEKVMNFSVPQSQPQQPAATTQPVIPQAITPQPLPTAPAQSQAYIGKKFEFPFLKLGVGLGIVVFLCVYTLIWIKILHVSVPVVNP